MKQPEKLWNRQKWFIAALWSNILMHSNHFPWPGELEIQTNQSLPLIRGTCNRNKSMNSPGQGNLQYKQINNFPWSEEFAIKTNQSLSVPRETCNTSTKIVAFGEKTKLWQKYSWSPNFELIRIMLGWVKVCWGYWQI